MGKDKNVILKKDFVPTLILSLKKYSSEVMLPRLGCRGKLPLEYQGRQSGCTQNCEGKRN